MSEENKIRDAADAIKGVIEAVPIYEDALQPAAKEIGSALQTVVKTVHMALAPVSALVWGYEKIQDFISGKLSEKLKDVPEENIIPPKPNVAGPALESLRYTGHEESLRDMYANLLASAMDSRTASGAHPAFVEIIRQLTPDEAKIIKLFAFDRPFPLLNVRWEYKEQTDTQRGGKEILTHFSLLGFEAGCELPDLTPTYLDNICRLGLAEVPTYMEYTAKGVYEPLENHQSIQDIKRQIEQNPQIVFKMERKALKITDLGKQFCLVCSISHELKGLPSKSAV